MQVQNRRVVKKEKKKDFFSALLAQVPLSPPLLWEGATRMCTTYVRTLLLTPLALVVLLVAYVNAKGGSPCCGQPGSAAHCGGGDKTSHPTCRPAPTQTLRASMTSALTPEMLKPSASSLRQEQLSEPGGNLTSPTSQGAMVGCCPTGTGAASRCLLAQGGRVLARCLGGLTHMGPGWVPHGSGTQPLAAPGPFVRAASLTSLGTPWGCG